MKNDKICINKSVMFIAVVAVILLGVVMATNYVNTQNLSTKSRAEVVADVTPPASPPVMAGSTFALSDLKVKADVAIKKLENVLIVSLNKGQINAKKSAIEVGVSTATQALAAVKQEAGTLGDLIASNKEDLVAAQSRVSVKEGLLASAKINTKQAQIRRDEDKIKLQQAENELNSNPDVAATKKAVDDARKLSEDAVFALFSIDTSSIDPGVLAGLKSVVLIADTDKYITSLERGKTLVNLPIFSTAQRSNYLASLASLTSAQAQYKSAKLKAFEAEDLRRINGAINVLIAKLDESEKKLQEAQAKEDVAAMDLAKEVVIKQMADSINSYDLTLKSFTGSLTETSVLPSPLTKISLPNPTLGASTTAVDSINSGIDKVNNVLSSASNAYNNLNDSIEEAMVEKQAQLNTNEQYCGNISPKGVYHAVLAYDRKGNLVNGGEVPSFVKTFYDKNCAANEGNPLWNGKYGEDAKCYKTIGICSSKEKPVVNGDIVNVGDNPEGNPKMCINREVELSECISRRTAPNSVEQSVQQCKEYGKFAWVGMGSYTVVHDINTYLGVQPATPTPAPASGLSNTCVLLRPGTTDVPCFEISPRYCQYKDDGYVVKSVDANGIGTYVDKNDDSKTWEAPGFDSDY